MRAPGSPPLTTAPRAAAISRSVVIVGMLVGAAIGVQAIGGWPMIVVGALAGFLVSSRLIRTGSPAHDGIARGRFPAGLVGFILSAGSWAGVILTARWVATRPPGTFNDQGGMIITFAVLPLMLICWTLGGPVALISGGYALRQVQSGAQPESERRLAQITVMLAWSLTLTGLGFVIWRIAAESSR